MRAAIAAGAAVLLTVALAACSGPNHGRVHDKRYTPAYTSTTTSCTGSGNSRFCYPVTTYYDDEYSLDVYASDDDHGWRDVTAAEYASCAIGDYYNGKACQ